METPITLSVDQEMQILNKAKTSQHLTHAQARGIIKLFHYYFKQRDSTGRIKRLSKQEKARKWKLYKTKVYQQYNRLIKSEFSSEAALVKRYSDPMTFLKYKLKRHRNLKVSDLSLADQDYYHELGGVDDIDEMRRRQANLDSLPKTQRKAFNTTQMELDGTDVAVHNNHNHNHNVNNIESQVHIQPSHFMPNTGYIQSIPPETKNVMPELSEIITEPKIDTTLEQLHQNYSDFEREQMDKKKDVANILTKEKTKAFLIEMADQMTTKPSLIGMMPGLNLKHQLLIGFQSWISQNINKIMEFGYNKNLLTQKLAMIKGDNTETLLFLQHWKMRRIIFGDDFRTVWTFVCMSLNIRKPNDKQEASDDEETKTDDL